MGFACQANRLRRLRRSPSKKGFACQASVLRKLRRSPSATLPGWHAERAVEPDDLAVEHRVLDDVGGEGRVLVRAAEAARVRDLLAERGAGGLGEPGEQRRV